MAKKEKINDQEQNWKLKKIFQYFEKDRYAWEGKKALNHVVKKLEECNWDVDVATEEARRFAAYCDRDRQLGDLSQNH